MIRKILEATNPKLREKSKPVKKIDKKVQSLISDLKETLVVQKDPEGIGLAAPQIGKNVRVFVMKPGKVITTFINPKIIKIQKSTTVKARGRARKKEKRIMEGCLSLPHYYGPITRAKKVVLEYTDEKGNRQIKTFEGIEAQIVLHEIDHLDGILFVDRLLEQKKPLYEYKDGEWEQVELP